MTNAEKLADMIAAAIANIDVEGFISISHSPATGKVGVMMNHEAFLQTFEGADFETTECPNIDSLEHKITTPGGNEVYCLEKAEFKLVRVAK